VIRGALPTSRMRRVLAWAREHPDLITLDYKMPAGDVLVLEGPSLDYARSGPICLTAVNAIYPWIMLARFGVKTSALDYDETADCYRPSCPCGIVTYEVRRL
jgi:uncharacterized repeat protein (TIGR04076 family)